METAVWMRGMEDNGISESDGLRAQMKQNLLDSLDAY